MNFSRRFSLFLIAMLLGVVLGTASASAATTHYLRPDGTYFTPKSWKVIGAPTASAAIDDEVTELQVPGSTDYIAQSNGGGYETRVSLASMDISGVSIINAQIWYYAATSQPFEVSASEGASWQLSNSVGWHSVSLAIPSQSALDQSTIRFRTNSSSSVPREVRAAFLKIETNGPRVYWGAWMDGDVYKATFPGLSDAPWNQTTWDLFESHTKKPVSIVHFGQPAPWEQGFSADPLEKTKKRGALPLMDMGTGCRIGNICKGGETFEEEEENRVSLKEINEGKYDIYYEDWAEDVAQYQYPLFFRWAWEMNGTWFKWGRDAANAPSEFTEAWRRLHGIAKAKGANNITWVWCPNVQYLGSTPYSQLYPGDAYVDWTCLDGYNEGGLTFRNVFEASYSALTNNIAPSKPVMIGETATYSEGSGGSHLTQENWIREAVSALKTQFPKIKAFVWFNWNTIENGKERPWPIETTLNGQQAFANEIASPYFAANEYKEPALLQPIKPLP
jgi:Glycosyl hydrolase family 26